MPFKVTKQYPRGTDTFCADFSDLNDAKAYVAEKLGPEAAMNVKVTYRIYEFDQLIEEFDATNIPAKPAQADTQGGQGQGKSSEATFRPTPFNTTPRPAGTPQKWIHDADEDEEKKK